jgi:hypothetical protein
MKGVTLSTTEDQPVEGQPGIEDAGEEIKPADPPEPGETGSESAPGGPAVEPPVVEGADEGTGDDEGAAS